MLNTNTNIIIDHLTENGCSIVQETYAEINGKLYTTGSYRTVYSNCPKDRVALEARLDQKYIDAIFAIWGNVSANTSVTNNCVNC